MTRWEEGYPTKPGWYVLHYSSDQYEAVHLVALSALLRVPNPEHFGIKRYFEFWPSESENPQ